MFKFYTIGIDVTELDEKLLKKFVKENRSFLDSGNSKRTTEVKFALILKREQEKFFLDYPNISLISSNNNKNKLHNIVKAKDFLQSEDEIITSQNFFWLNFEKFFIENVEKKMADFSTYIENRNMLNIVFEVDNLEEMNNPNLFKKTIEMIQVINPKIQSEKINLFFKIKDLKNSEVSFLLKDKKISGFFMYGDKINKISFT